MLLTINSTNLTHNYLLYKQKQDCAAVIKSDAYGFGINNIVPILLKATCRQFFVANPHEAYITYLICAKTLQNNNELQTIRIYILNGQLIHNYLSSNNICNTILPNIIITVHSSIENAAMDSNTCWLQVDTGLGRLGVEYTELLQYTPVSTHSKKPNTLPTNITGLLTQLVESEVYSIITKQQIQSMYTLQQHFPNLTLSLATTGSIGFHCEFNLLRMGRGLYGSAHTDNPHYQQFKSVINITATILQRKHIRKGQGLGYDHKFIAPENLNIYILNIGYYHGLPKNTPWMIHVGMDLSLVDTRHVRLCPNGHAIIIDNIYTLDHMAIDCHMPVRQLMSNFGTGANSINRIHIIES